MSKFFHRDIVVLINAPDTEYTVLKDGMEEGSPNDENSILVFDGDNDAIISLNKSDVQKINQWDDLDVYFCPPIFEELLLSSRVKLKTSNAKGIVIAINPMIIPLTDQCHYLIHMEDGCFQEFSSSEIELDE